MSRLESALRRLAEGEFVCQVRYPAEYGALVTEAGRAHAEQWLEAIGYRLCQLEADGAFFMGYSSIEPEGKARLRDEMRNLRHRLDPAVRFLETLRQAQGRTAQLMPGDIVVHDEIMSAVRTNAALDQRLSEMRDVHASRLTESAADRLDRILVQLEKDGYLQLANPNFRTYTVTGKIVYLYQLLAFMNEHVPQMNDEGAGDQIEQQLALAPQGPDKAASSGEDPAA
jgi:hypothetical protein